MSNQIARGRKTSKNIFARVSHKSIQNIALSMQKKKKYGLKNQSKDEKSKCFIHRREPPN